MIVITMKTEVISEVSCGRWDLNYVLNVGQNLNKWQKEDTPVKVDEIEVGINKVLKEKQIADCSI